MNLEKNNFITLVNRYFLVIATLFLFVVFFSRFAVGGFDPGRFILLSNEFIVKENFDQDISVYDNGYDGLFFYRYALNPFSKDIKYDKKYGRYGIKVDNAKYRRGRIIYPLFAWTLALGQASFVPYTLILVNIFAFVFLILISKKIVSHFRAPPIYALFPLLIGGLYLSVARNLSDTLGCTLLALCYLLYLKDRITWFLISSTLLLLCRESSAFFLIPAYGLLFLKRTHYDSFIQEAKSKLLLFLPFLVLIASKILLHFLYPDIHSKFIKHLSKHFGLPFQGMLKSVHSEVYFFKLIYLLWTFYFFGICLKAAFKNWKLSLRSWMFWALLISIILTVSYRESIYVDHWSFTRILAPSHLFCFYFLLEYKIKIPKLLIAGGFYVIYHSIKLVIYFL